MKKKIWIYGLVSAGMFSLLAGGCSKIGTNNNNTTSQLPNVTTNAIANVTQTTATCGGNVIFGGPDSVIARGVCWATSINPTISFPHSTDGRGNGTFTSNLTGLNPCTPFYVRAYATNSAGTGYGEQVKFTTQWVNGGGTIKDIDGNVYHTVTIGTKKAPLSSQVWMAENLKTTRFNDGTSISIVTDESLWEGLLTPAYCWNNNDSTYKDSYGAYYNGYALITNKLCPTGWHVPSNSEWEILFSSLGGDSIAGGKMKSAGTIESGLGLWYAPNAGGTNESGFTARPGGRRAYGGFHDMGYYAHFWTSTQAGYTGAWSKDLDYNFSVIHVSTFDFTAGMSIRCLKDN